MRKVPALGSQLIATSGVHFRHPGVARIKIFRHTDWWEREALDGVG